MALAPTKLRKQDVFVWKGRRSHPLFQGAYALWFIHRAILRQNFRAGNQRTLDRYSNPLGVDTPQNPLLGSNHLLGFIRLTVIMADEMEYTMGYQELDFFV